MDRQALQETMYELRGRSLPQRITLAAAAGAWVAVAWWLLFGGGIETAGSWFGRIWRPGGLGRRALLASGLSIYYVRVLFTEFAFLKRGVGWSEVFTIAPWVLGIYLLLAIAGGKNEAPVGTGAKAGIALFLLGSWMNSYSEYARDAWKQRPENKGRLYTEGLFRYSRHPNYLGDLISFSGLSMMTGSPVTAAIPAAMLAGFVFVNIPVLDSHLQKKYGAEFDEYAKRTVKLVPFAY